MNRPPTNAPGLSRRSTGLLPAHRELIRLLAAVAVEEFLCERDTTTDAAPADAQEEDPA
jgi:hypothetical protein